MLIFIANYLNIFAVSSDTEPRGAWRIVVDSIGRADARLIGVLARVLERGEQQIAALLLRSPAVLVDSMPRELADRTAALLRETGIELRVIADDEPFEPGEGHFEVALVVHDIDRISEITAEVARVVGCSATQAIELVCATPAVLLAGVSANTVEALRDRFVKLGAELIASDTRVARYDVVVVDPEAREAGRVARLLEGLGMQRDADKGFAGTGEGGGTPSIPVVAFDLDRKQTEALWERLRGAGGPLRVFDRSFARFDIRLSAAGDHPEFAQWLAADTGMPLGLAGEIGRHLPIVLHEELPRERAEACLLGLAERGARAEALPTCFQTFDLELRELGRRDATLDLLAGLGRLPAERIAELEPRLRSHASGLRIPGPFAKLRARWLVAEAERVGTRMEMVPR
jgi:ribosomal protein L7/L12